MILEEFEKAFTPPTRLPTKECPYCGHCTSEVSTA